MKIYRIMNESTKKEIGIKHPQVTMFDGELLMVDVNEIWNFYLSDGTADRVYKYFFFFVVTFNSNEVKNVNQNQ